LLGLGRGRFALRDAVAPLRDAVDPLLFAALARWLVLRPPMSHSS
jgi:hypothetical protein